MSTATTTTNPPLYTSRLSIPYSSKSVLNTLDIHTPTTPPLSPSYHLIYIHGGAFRDPLQTSLTIIPSLPALFSSPSSPSTTTTHHIASIASVNYRLCPHPQYPTGPDDDGEEGDGKSKGRNAKWPDAIEDVRDAVRWLKAEWEKEMGEGEEEGGWIICGHSVGGTMAVMIGMDGMGSNDVSEKSKGDEWAGREGIWGLEGGMEGLKGVITLEGIYDFTACRDAHPKIREMYDAFTTGAFGPEEAGGWERGNVLGCKRGFRDGVEVVVVGHSREDELVEWEQGRRLMGMLEGREREGEVRFVEVSGGHAQIVKDGVEVGKCVDVAVAVLVEKAAAKTRAKEEEKKEKGGG